MPLSVQLRSALDEFIVGYGETHKIKPGKQYGSFTTAEIGDEPVSSFKVKTADGKTVVIMVRGGPRGGKAEILVPGWRGPKMLSVQQAFMLKGQIPFYKKSELNDLISGRIGDRRRQTEAKWKMPPIQRALINMGSKAGYVATDQFVRCKDWDKYLLARIKAAAKKLGIYGGTHRAAGYTYVDLLPAATEDLDAVFEAALVERSLVDFTGSPVLKGEEYILRHRRKGDWVASDGNLQKGKLPLTMKRGLAKTWSGRDLLGTTFDWSSEYKAVRLKGED